MNHLFVEISLVIVMAAVLGGIAQLLKQPAILGYIATGLLVGPLGIVPIGNHEALDAMAQIGITFLLFLVGIEMRFADLKRVGKVAVLTGIGQIVFTSVIGYGIMRLLGFAHLVSIYAAIALTFSSTIIVVKLLSEKHDLESLYGKIVVGFLLVQDFVALGILMVLSSLAGAGTAVDLGSIPLASLGLIFLKGTLLLVFALFVGRYVMPGLLRVVSRSPEILFLVSLAWGMGMAALVSLPFIGFTIEIGGLMAGVAMAGSFEHSHISSRVKSLRDFFLVLFFVVLGSKMVLAGFAGLLGPTIALSLFILIGNPLIVMVIMGALGFRSRTAFLASVTVAQISEFSLILMALALRVGHVDEGVVSMITAVGIITIAASSYMILYAERLYSWLKPFLKVFEFRKGGFEEDQTAVDLDGHVVLIGCHRMGHNILQSLQDMHKEFVVIDFNPDVVHRLLKQGVRAIYGDVTDEDISELAGLTRARLIISTVPHLADSQQVMEELKKAGSKAKVVLTAENENDAVRLYALGADYVLLPHFIGGLQLARTIEQDATFEAFSKMREQDLSIIATRL
jgi:Kef-type K+ transport system membrane component KefB/voltage-gated potassium channel Kch